MNIPERLIELGLELPPPPVPAAHYVPWVLSDGHVYVAGQTPKIGTTLQYAGQIGAELSTQEGYQAAQLCVLRSLSALQAAATDLHRVRQIVKLTVYVNAAHGYTEHPAVADGASDLLVQLLGASGQHARSAVGVSSLPGNAAVEVDLVARL